MKRSPAISGLAIFGTSCVALAFVPSAQVGPVTKIAGSSSSATSSARTSPLFAEAANGDLVANGDAVNGLNGLTSGELLGLPARPGRPLKVAIAGGMSFVFCLHICLFSLKIFSALADFSRVRLEPWCAVQDRCQP